MTSEMIAPPAMINSSTSQRRQIFSAAVGGFVLIVGVLVLAGWALDLERLKTIFPGYASMKVNTAASLALCGAALLLRALGADTARRRFWTVALSSPVVAFGALTLAEYLFGCDLGIDDWSLLSSRSAAAAAALNPARMAPATAYCVMLIGSGLIVSVLRPKKTPDWRLPVMAASGAAVLSVGALALISYLSTASLRAPLLIQAGPALHTSVVFVLMGAALLALARSEGGLVWALNRFVSLGLMLGVTIMLLAASASFNFTQRLIRSANAVAHTEEVLKDIEEVETGLAELESSQRGYIITGNEDLLLTRGKKEADVIAALTAIGELTLDNPSQQERLIPPHAMFYQRLEFGNSTINVRRESGFAAARRMIDSGVGIGLSAQLSKALGEMEAEENALREQRQIASSMVSTTTFLLLPVGVFLSITILFAGVFFLNTGVWERTCANADLRKSEERLQAVVENLTEGLVLCDAEGKMLLWNRAGMEMHGFKDLEDCQRALPEFSNLFDIRTLDGAPLPFSEWPLPRLLRGEQLRNVELQVRNIANGPARVFSYNGNLVQCPGGERLALTSITDVTERKRIEQDLKAGEERLTVVTENAQVGLVMVDRERRYKYTNAAYSKILRLPSNDLAGQRVEDVLPGLYQTQICPRLDQAFAGERVSYEMHQASAGTGRHFAVRYEPTLVDGEVPFVVVVIIDITERKEAEATRVLLSAIIDSSHDAIVGKDLSGMVTSWNAGAQRMFGYTAQEMIGRSVTSLIPADRQDEEESILSRIRSGQVVEHFDTVRTRKGGDVLNVSVTVSPIRDPDGNVVGASKIARDITRRKEIEARLRDSEVAQRRAAEAQTGVLNALPAHIALLDPAGVIVAVNESWRRFATFNALQSADFTIGVNYLQVCETAVGDCSTESLLVSAGLRNVLAARKHSFEIEYPCHSPSEKRWFRLMAAPLRPGLQEGAVIMYIDVTDRRLAEEASRESEERFRTMANAIPQLAWVARADGYIFWYNQRWYEYTGTQAEDMKGWGWQGVHDPQALPHVMAQWTAAIASQATFEMEFPLRGANGKFRRFLTRAVPLKNAEDCVVQWFGTNTDVEELKSIEEDLRRSEASLLAAQTHAKIGSWELDLSTNGLTWSPEMFRLFMCDPALGAPAYEEALAKFDLQDQELFRRNLAASLESGEELEQDMSFVRPDGSTCWIAARSKPPQLTERRTGRIVGTAQDITERKRVENEVHRLNAELEQRVIERTSQLEVANVALEIARVRAETADHAKSAFLASMSHELRTPLNGIIGFSEFLIDGKPGPLNPKQDEYLNDVLSSARHLLQLINDVLDLAKVEAGKIDLYPERFSPKTAINGVCAVIKSIALKKGVNVVVTTCDELETVFLDQQKFKQVCYNLLSNAVKFTPASGAVTIDVATCVGGRFKVRVHDTGIGMRKEDLPRLFREFEQLASAEHRAGGTGLGLVLTKKLVEAQQGHISVESEYGVGSTFLVNFVMLRLELEQTG